MPTSETIRRALKALWERQGRLGGDSLVWVALNGVPMNDGNLRRRVLRPACEAGKVRRIDWHTLRHTFTTLMQASGVPKPVVRDLLGHNRESTSDVYTHSFTEQQQEAVESMEILFISVHSRDQQAAQLAVQSKMIQ